MPHFWRPLAHKRNSIFKCKQHTIHDSRGPEKYIYTMLPLNFGPNPLLVVKHKSMGNIRGVTMQLLCSACVAHFLSFFHHILLHKITGYKQRVTGCGSQRRQCSCYSMKTYVNSVILILKLNLTSMRNKYIKIGLRWVPHTFWCICFSSKSNSIWGWRSNCLHKFSLSINYIFVENHNLWRFDCTQWKQYLNIQDLILSII